MGSVNQAVTIETEPSPGYTNLQRPDQVYEEIPDKPDDDYIVPKRQGEGYEDIQESS